MIFKTTIFKQYQKSPIQVSPLFNNHNQVTYFTIDYYKHIFFSQFHTHKTHHSSQQNQHTRPSPFGPPSRRTTDKKTSPKPRKFKQTTQEHPHKSRPSNRLIFDIFSKRDYVRSSWTPRGHVARFRIRPVIKWIRLI